MATTPIYELPYPVGTDLIVDGDNAIRALAERVEAVLDAAGVTPPVPAAPAHPIELPEGQTDDGT